MLTMSALPPKTDIKLDLSGGVGLLAAQLPHLASYRRYLASTRKIFSCRITRFSFVTQREDKRMKRVIAIALAASLGACAKDADQIVAMKVSPAQFQNFNCKQLYEDRLAMENRVNALSAQQDSKASGDTMKVAASLLILPIAAPFVASGNGQTATEIGQAKGELQAIKDMGRHTQCPRPVWR